MKRLLPVVACAALLLLSPFFSRSSAITSIAPFATQALAGHVIGTGRYCECGSSDACICEPGDLGSLKATANQNNTSVSNKGLTGQPLAPDTEPGLALLVLALLFAMLFRIR